MRAGEIVRRLREFVTRGEFGEDGAAPLDARRRGDDRSPSPASRQVGARLSVATRAQDDFVLADRVQIQQVVVNLMRNAVEAMDGARAAGVVARPPRPPTAMCGSTSPTRAMG